jgi:hypothetical protein
VIVDVLACREGNMWVVCSLDPDLASQSSPAGSGEHEALTDAITDLGRMFDFYDDLPPDVRGPVGPSPDSYHHEFAAGLLLGLFPLGRSRVARVRLGTSPYVRSKP